MSATNRTLGRSEVVDFYPGVNTAKLQGRSKAQKDAQAHFVLLVTVLAGIAIISPIVSFGNFYEWVNNVVCGVVFIASLFAASTLIKHLEIKQAMDEDDTRSEKSGSLVKLMRSKGYVIGESTAERMLAGTAHSGSKIVDLDGYPYTIVSIVVWKKYYRFQFASKDELKKRH